MPDYMVKRKLPVELTDDELLSLGAELAKDEQDLSGVENEKKEVLLINPGSTIKFVRFFLMSPGR